MKEGCADSNVGERQSIEIIITEPEAIPRAEKGMERKEQNRYRCRTSRWNCFRRETID